MIYTQNSIISKKRVDYWDNIKGILIIFVVLGHFLLDYLAFDYAKYIISFIYFFHMPAFIFVSGFLSKSDSTRSNKSIIKLIVIYLIFNTATMIVSTLLFDLPYHFITPYYSYWYLIALAVWRTTLKYTERFKDILFISIIAAFLIGFWSDVTNVFSVSRIIVFYPFFIVGYKLQTDKIYDIVNKRNKKEILKTILLLIIAVIISVYFTYKINYLDLNHLTMGSYNSIHDLFIRMVIFMIACVMIIAILNLTPNKQIIFISNCGKNSLSIYVLHRFITFAFAKTFPADNYSNIYIIYAIFASVIILIFLGTNTVNELFNNTIDKIIDSIIYNYNNKGNPTKYKIRKFTTLLLLTCYLMIPLILEPIKILGSKPESNNDVTHKVMTTQQMNEVENALSIAFVGDLILLQKQVIGAYDENTGDYNFNPMFEYAKKYISEADLAVGIFEGPMAGEDTGYSTGNYDDGLPLYLNYPDSFAAAVKESGIDLVSTANNHLLDKGVAGALRTLDVLDYNELLYIGSYRNSAEKDSVMILEKKGVRIGVLAYTFASNYYEDEHFVKENPSITSIIVKPGSKYFKQVKKQVLDDFKKMQNMDNPPDLIMVIPHMGTQFIHETDDFQKTWNEIFINAGADIILGDHSHAVQPIEFKSINRKNGKKTSVIVNCPGNFANSYVDYNGDATSIVEIYININQKKVIGASVIPMYTHSSDDYNYKALPIYDILNNDSLKNKISPYEMRRVEEVNKIVTSVMISAEIPLDQIQDKYYLFPEGYFRQPVKPIEISEEKKNSEVYKLINEAGSICFVGDSITAGSKNGGYGWYEPMMEAFSGKTVYKEAWDSATTKTLLDNSELIAEHSADLYFIAIGTNDVRYSDKNICAMNSEEYIENIDKLANEILEHNPDAKFIFISPWLALNNDPYTKLDIEKRDNMLQDYGESLKSFCEKNGQIFIDVNKEIYEEFLKASTNKYMIDHIHPNAGAGINMYSEKVISCKYK